MYCGAMQRSLLHVFAALSQIEFRFWCDYPRVTIARSQINLCTYRLVIQSARKHVMHVLVIANLACKLAVGSLGETQGTPAAANA